MAIARRIHLFGETALWRRWRNTIRTLFTRGDLSTLVIVCLLMIIPAIALSSVLPVQNDAHYWSVGLGQLTIVAVASVVFGFLLARSHYGELLALLMSGVYGIATITVLQLLAAPGDPLTRLVAVVSRLRTSLLQTASGGAIQDPFLLVLFLSTLFWFLGHNTAWHVFRIDRVWRAVVPPGIVLLINGLYNFGPANLDFYLIVYTFLALLLVVRSHIDAREYDWFVNRIGFERGLRTWFYRTGAMAGVILLIVAWVLPTGSSEQNQKRFQEFLNGELINNLNKLAQRLFAPLEGEGVTTADYYGRDRLQLGGAIQLGDQVVMLVTVGAAGPRYYWKSRVFDTYNNGEWSSARGLNISAQNAPLNLPPEPYAAGTRQDVTQRFTMVIGPSRLIYAAPQAYRIDLPAQTDADYMDPTAKTLNPSVVRPLTALGEGDSYTAHSLVSTVSADVLRGAAQSARDYPPWLLLDEKLDPNTAPQTQQLARQIVRDAKANNAYDKAKAIESWLRTHITYDEAMPSPPANEDIIDWVVFKIKRAYCTYYASAMIIMLRSLGIPARMAAGFAQGTWDPASQSYIVRERDAHTWVEAYFPGAGWVEFEPTSAQQPLDRPDPRAPKATPSNTPTPTPSPTPLPTATPAGKPQNVAPQTVAPPTETSTPTFTPTPTATPLPPIPPKPGPLSGALALGILGAALIAIASFLGVGLFWWVEYRGLDRLSPVGKAYARLGIYARWLRIPTTPGSTPLERGRRIAREVPDRSVQVTAITDMYIHERYAPPKPISPNMELRANQAWQSARWGMIRQKIRRWLRRK